MRGDDVQKFSNADIQAYELHGVACLRQVIDPTWIDHLRRAADQVLRAPSEAVRYSPPKSDSGRFIRDRFLWTFNDDFKDFAFTSPLPQIAAQFMRSSAVYLMLDLIFAKEPHAADATPWHHDQPYGWYDGNQVCQFWVPLDTADLHSGTLEFVRGSHRWGKWFNLVNFVTNEYETRDYEDLPDINARRESYDVVHYDMEPGDCVVFSELTLHSAPPNSTSRPRRAISLHYAGDDARYAIRKYSRLPVRDPGLKPGDPFGCELFPRVWQAQAMVA